MTPALRHILQIVETGDTYYKDHFARNDARNRAFVRGRHWLSSNESLSVDTVDTEIRQYVAQQNEISPALESKLTLLAPDDPAVQLVDLREGASVQNGVKGSGPAARRQAAILNRWSLDDGFRSTVKQWIAVASTYDKGGILRMEWSPGKQRTVMRLRMPWEVHWDPLARHPDDVAWYYERFALHYPTYKKRIEAGQYAAPPDPVKPTEISPSLLEDFQDDRAAEADKRKVEPKAWVTILEFWDVIEKKVYHILEESRHILSCQEAAVSSPYIHLLFTQDPPQLTTVADVSHAANTQRTINRMVAARDECVDRLVPKTIVDDGIFLDAKAKEDFLAAKMTETSSVSPKSGDPRPISHYFHVIPAAQLPNDFNRHLAESVEHIRNTLSVAEYQRGQVANIRTAQEAAMLQDATTARAKEQATTLKGAVRSVYTLMRDYLRWAVIHTNESGLDVAKLLRKTVAEPLDPATFQAEIEDEALSLVVMPFSPLMSDSITAGTKLELLIPAMASVPPLAMAVDWYGLAEEIARGQHWNKDLLIPRDAWMKMVAGAGGGPAPEVPPGPPSEAPPESLPLPEGEAPPNPIDQVIQAALASQGAVA